MKKIWFKGILIGTAILGVMVAGYYICNTMIFVDSKPNATEEATTETSINTSSKEVNTQTSSEFLTKYLEAMEKGHVGYLRDNSSLSKSRLFGTTDTPYLFLGITGGDSELKNYTIHKQENNILRVEAISVGEFKVTVIVDVTVRQINYDEGWVVTDYDVVSREYMTPSKVVATGDTIIDFVGREVVFRGYTAENHIAISVAGQMNFYKIFENKELLINAGGRLIHVKANTDDTILVRGSTTGQKDSD